ncbi:MULTISPECIES: amino acid ABC transporter permease [Leuconostoc]|jgi:aspartate/glutamate/glutamine transport system permease protein|uniref:Amino acid ABC transporter permease n=1 Tax=Leuconostoc pseudomesenteroides TaxID=33968 RepID=A0A5B8T392_LEUPS|nr:MULTISPECIES: amino acid ABC transporter permease [Leuconostoc]MBK0040384.1 amino acid ABC transporter permease [Leuconostoc sp. S51]MBK0051290.1 amino acid ABC transporter permease [Leuconostoc sp. S50]MBS0958429.1 amino acid ABC transporter permease [Leuconostoc pseudomesenteroides]MCC7669060.1 amino acid ABC transporter permease [Leuconostoc pseudomesenteroides]MCC8440441.1 amino acid ABC transporter permease [Leuconostoc pseudomesenteroides]
MVTLGIFDAFTPQNVQYLLGGLGITVGVSVISVILSFIAGSVIGIIQFERLPYFSKFVGTINNIIRNLPLLLIIFFVYFALPKLGIHLPIFWATVVAMSTFESSMLAEIVRGGLESIDKGQFEGARANGLSNLQTMFYIVLPQAYKKMIPPIISQLISLVKDTSLAMGIVLSEMTYRGQIIYAQNSTYIIPVLIVITLIYFLLNYGLSLIARWFDSKLA